jgi:hypothetical protein
MFHHLMRCAGNFKPLYLNGWLNLKYIFYSYSSIIQIDFVVIALCVVS